MAQLASGSVPGHNFSATELKMEGQYNHPASTRGAEAFVASGTGRTTGPVIIPLADMSPADLDQPRYALPATSDVAIAGIGPIWRWSVSVEGVCERSTTTAGDRQRDALLSATRFIEAAKRIVRHEPKQPNATIAHEPGAARLPNAVGGRYALQLELRDADASTVVRVYERMALEAWTIGRLSRTRFCFEPHRTNPVPSFGQYVADAGPRAVAGGRW
jgi:hypothetical protein